MIEQVITKKNMRLACTHVVKNKGSAGVDGMQVSELYPYVQQHLPVLKEQATAAH